MIQTISILLKQYCLSLVWRKFMQNALPQFNNDKKHPFAQRVVSNGEEIFYDFVSPKIAERLRGTEFDTNGQVFLVSFEDIKRILGNKWEGKKKQICEYIKSSFERVHENPNWCSQVNEESFIFVLPTLLPRQGAKESANILQATTKFFVGDVESTSLPIYYVFVETVTKLTLKRINAEVYSDVIPPKKTKTETPEKVSDSFSDTQKITLMSKSGQEVNYGIKVSFEKFYQLKNMGIIGHRLRYNLYDITNINSPLLKSIETLTQTEREQIDIIGLEIGIRIYNNISNESRKILFIAPVAFNTLTAISARTKIIDTITDFSNENGIKAIIEIHGVNNVPQYRVIEQVSYLKSKNIAVVCENITDINIMHEYKNAKIDGFSLEYINANRSKEETINYIKTLQHITKSCHGFIYVHGFNEQKESEIARIAGFGHVTIAN